MADNVFDKIEEQNVKIDEQGIKLDKLSEQVESLKDTLQKTNKSQQIVVSNPVNKQKLLQDFLQNSTKTYRWFGEEKDFRKDKTIALSFLICTIAMGIISTILTSISLKIYSTFSLLENIVVYASCWQLGYVCKLKLSVSDIDLSLHSTDIFVLNGDRLMISTNKEKKRYKVFRILCYISIVCNVIGIWTFPGSSKSVLATIFEILFLGCIIAARWFYVGLTCMYHFVYFSGKTIAGRNLTLVWDRNKELVTEEDFNKKHPFVN